MNLETQTRRSAIKTLAIYTATCLFPAKWAGQAIADVTTPTTGELGFVRINVSDFPALMNVGGSVRIGTSPLLAFHPTGVFAPIIITRASSGSFHTLDAQCTHESCAVGKFSSTSSFMECPCHGSRFAIDGAVIRGPANFPLRRFNNEFDGQNSLKIEVPEIGFTLATQRVLPASANRLKIEFLGFSNLTYKVRFKPQVKAAWADVLFALSPEAAADQTSYAGMDDYASVYVDTKGAAGFYAVFMDVKQV